MVTTAYDPAIQIAVDEYLPDWDWRLLKAQFIAESRMNPDAVSPVGARGIAQFMPATWREECELLGFPADADPHDPQFAILAGAHYMSRMVQGWPAPRPGIDRYCLALASYNAGLGNLYTAQKVARGANDYASIIRALPSVTGRHARETTAYVKRILMHYGELVTG